MERDAMLTPREAAEYLKVPIETIGGGAVKGPCLRSRSANTGAFPAGNWLRPWPRRAQGENAQMRKNHPPNEGAIRKAFTLSIGKLRGKTTCAASLSRTKKAGWARQLPR